MAEFNRRSNRGAAIVRSKSCKFLEGVDPVEYTDTDLLRRFVTERGKILPSRITGTSARQQREITRAIKRARTMGLLP
ncbi:MAG: 30S ribosomal protein S18 [Verrucomicrobiota bacterium]|jgi:small subunit ribosomal protein S18|nr:30S ribosomal protein S18 [Verrucomicrobiota bacterium]MDD8044930.1 30S ribosomal protein S18 [Verrucomicrobiota bacterium]HCF95546.1 30S ribosomal protein S18 [Verrucomicrobiota bacterium]